MYNLVKDEETNRIYLESITSLIFGNATTSSSAEEIHTDLLFYYRYKINQQQSDLDVGITLTLDNFQTSSTEDLSSEVSVIVTYYSQTQLGDGTNNSESISFSGEKTSGKSAIYSKFNDELKGQNDTYIIFEPIKNTTKPVSFDIIVSYGTRLVHKFTVSSYDIATQS